jgi:hypothetical protein
VIGSLLVLAALPAVLSACQVPVFRYALEHWNPDPFEVVVLYRQSLSSDQQQLVDVLRAAAAPESDSPLNANVILLDASQVKPEEDSYEWRVVQQYGDRPLPHLLVFFPLRQAGPERVWSGPLTRRNIQALVQSPAREEIARRLLDGQSAVWVLIESGDAERDDQAEAALRAGLDAQSDKIHLPSLAELAMEDKFNQDVDVELRVEFSLVRISRSDPREEVFREVLLHSEPDLHDFEDPIAIPVFGRGRSYYALVGRGINQDTIDANCLFICGPCSCEAKLLNPGRDMLMAANWAQIIPRDWSMPTPLPELTGVGAFEAALQAESEQAVATPVRVEPEATTPSQPTSLASAAIPETDRAAASGAPVGSGRGQAARDQPDPARGPATTTAAPQPGSSLERSLLMVLGGLVGLGLCIVAGVTWWLRAGQSP